MALSILDGNQSATTLSTILSSGQHITAHTVVSLGTQAITDMRGAVSGSVVSISNFPSTQTIAGTVTANLPALNWNTVKIAYGENDVWNGIYKKGSGGYVNNEGGGTPKYLPVDGNFFGGTAPNLTRGTHPGGVLSFAGTRWYFEADGDVRFYSTTTATDLRVIADWTDSGGAGADVQIAPYSVEPVAIPGGVEIAYSALGQAATTVTNGNPFPVKIQNSVTIGSLPAISGTVTANAGGGFPAVIYSGILEYIDSEGAIAVGINSALPAGTNRIGVVTIGAGTVTIGAGTAQIGSVTASISNSVTIASLPAISGTVTANLAISSTVITSGSFSSLTSATLVPANPARKMATVFNLGVGQLFINAGVTATTLGGGFMVALSSGDLFECNYTTTTLSAIFATAGTASWMSH